MSWLHAEAEVAPFWFAFEWAMGIGLGKRNLLVDYVTIIGEFRIC